ncbi:MAG: hypothetical protein K8H88_19155 [Sandaracinaceae bacterium]|nr:hypothetical protein [Sandaracinaceae bacterium]
MRAPLIPCSSCARHVRASERRCPFCTAALAPPRELPQLVRIGGLGRAAGEAGRRDREEGGAATGLAPIPEQDAAVVDAGRDSGPAASDAGPPSMDASFDAGLDAGPQIITLYGGPTPIFEDGGPDDDDDAGSVGDLYGAPPPV